VNGEYSARYTVVPPDSTENLSGVSEAEVTVSIIGLVSQNFNIHLLHLFHFFMELAKNNIY